MKAIVTSATGPTGFHFDDVPAPQPKPTEALVDVQAVSVNRGDTFHASYLPAGTVRGYDFAGVVREPAADGTGPAAGTRVAGLVPEGAWAEQVAAPTWGLASLPDGLSPEEGAATPVAGMTALYALQRGGWLLGRRVLVTGAAGGVGIFAVQLAARGGAHVTALVSSPARGSALTNLGADVVATYDNPPDAPADVLVESAGGTVFTTAMSLLAPRGIAISVGNSALADYVLPADYGFTRPGYSHGFLYLLEEIERRRTTDTDLGFLLQSIADRKLDPQIAVTAPWTDFAPLIQRLYDRQINGKAILTVAGT